jgi:murein DD-endopeptidase MepM/ murein hydrolase activator NlpD
VAETKAAETKVPAQTAATTPVAAKTANASSEKTAPAKQDVASTKTAAVDRTPVATVTPSNVKEEALSDSANPEFRWPARGRVIQGFKSGSNDGINISLPEGTPVKAAESGVVVYAGNELKGYGNLVLVKHPNGFVSAYANNGDLEVKRGDSVKRGQTLAKSGQSGNVSSPQLHFELRKGSTPVDPTGYLAGL